MSMNDLFDAPTLCAVLISLFACSMASVVAFCVRINEEKARSEYEYEALESGPRKEEAIFRLLPALLHSYALLLAGFTGWYGQRLGGSVDLRLAVILAA